MCINMQKLWLQLICKQLCKMENKLSCAALFINLCYMSIWWLKNYAEAQETRKPLSQQLWPETKSRRCVCNTPLLPEGLERTAIWGSFSLIYRAKYWGGKKKVQRTQSFNGKSDRLRLWFCKSLYLKQQQ